MSEILRAEIEAAMMTVGIDQSAMLQDDRVARNQQRIEAVEIFLLNKSVNEEVHDRVMSDLSGYSCWESEEPDAEPAAE